MAEHPEIPMSRLVSLRFGDTDLTEHVQRVVLVRDVDGLPVATDMMIKVDDDG